MSMVALDADDWVYTRFAVTVTFSSYVGVNTWERPEMSVGADDVVEEIVVAVPVALAIVANPLVVVSRLAVSVMP
jgi:hypothetical protein